MVVAIVQTKRKRKNVAFYNSLVFDYSDTHQIVVVATDKFPPKPYRLKILDMKQIQLVGNLMDLDQELHLKLMASLAYSERWNWEACKNPIVVIGLK
ncbi:hypothetical protein QE357_002715 [Siphonobacter sp. BAB-5404]|nr:hypothetical protein [Siphonobacter sp. SORGH_AS_0500]